MYRPSNRDPASLRAAFLAGAAIVLLLAAVLLPVRELTADLLAWVSRRGALSGVILCLAWIPAAVLLVPGSILTLGTGFLFGGVWGLVVVSIGSTLGATAAFIVGRRLGRDWVRERIGGHERMRGVDGAIAREGLKVVLLLRLSPLIPYNALNYALSLTAVGLRDYVLGSWLGMLPGTVPRGVEECRRRRPAAEGPVVADIGPDAPGHRLALGQDWHRGVVTTQALGREDMRLD